MQDQAGGPHILERQDALEELPVPKVAGFAVSPMIAMLSMTHAVSYLVAAIAPSENVFATVTNISFLGASLYRVGVVLSERHSSSPLVGQLAGSSLVYALMGGSSLAFHADPVMSSPAHSFDILFGWVLVMHVTFVCFSIVVFAIVKYFLWGWATLASMAYVRTALSISLLIGVTLLMAFYHDVYAVQKEFYFVMGPSAAVFGAVCRFILIYRDGKVNRLAVLIAVAELFVALLIVFAAIVSQCDLLGTVIRRVSDGTEQGDLNSRLYDFFHGHWHFLLAVVTSLLYSRGADAARAVQGSHLVCVCTLPYLDSFAYIILAVYSILLIWFKEAQYGIDASLAAGTTMTSFLVLHAFATLFSWITDDRYGLLSSREYGKGGPLWKATTAVHQLRAKVLDPEARDGRRGNATSETPRRGQAAQRADAREAREARRPLLPGGSARDGGTGPRTAVQNV
jgi:hypothetical protein